MLCPTSTWNSGTPTSRTISRTSSKDSSEVMRSSSLIQNYRATTEQLISQRANLIQTVPETHPAVVRVDAQLDELAANINAEANRIVEAARSDWLTRIRR